MRKCAGDRPQNARIKIDYSKSDKKPKVSFRYPVSRKNSKSIGSVLIYIFICWNVFFTLPFLFGVDIAGFFYNLNDTSTIQIFVECAARNSNITLTNYTYMEEELCDDPFDWKFSIFIMIIGLFSCIGMPSIIYFPFKKRWDKLYPDIQAFLVAKKHKRFSSEDLLRNKKGEYYIELPVFDNIVCDFKATKDFSKYLNLFEIEEYKFNYLLRRGKKKKRKNEFIWYARWYFKQQPKSGILEVIFK